MCPFGNVLLEERGVFRSHEMWGKENHFGLYLENFPKSTTPSFHLTHSLGRSNGRKLTKVFWLLVLFGTHFHLGSSCFCAFFMWFKSDSIFSRLHPRKSGERCPTFRAWGNSGCVPLFLWPLRLAYV